MNRKRVKIFCFCIYFAFVCINLEMEDYCFILESIEFDAINWCCISLEIHFKSKMYVKDLFKVVYLLATKIVENLHLLIYLKLLIF